MTRAALAAIAVVLAWVLGAGVARAQEPPPASGPIGLVPPRCASVSLDIGAFAAILAADLRYDGVDQVVLPSGGPPARPLLATITLESTPCAPETRDIDVTVEDMTTRKRVVRRILLQDVAGEARPRALALAVAELLRASWLELMTPDAPAPAVPVPTEVKRAVLLHLGAMVGPERPTEGAPPVPRRDISVLGAWRSSLGGHASLYGGRAAVGALLGPAVTLRFDLGGVVGSAQDALGDISLGMAELGAALLWTSPRESSVTAAFGARSELGLAWANGHASDTQTSSNYGSGFVWNALLLGEVAFHIAPTWRLAVDVEAGDTLVPLVALADSRRVTGLEGAMFGLAFGVLQLR